MMRRVPLWMAFFALLSLSMLACGKALPTAWTDVGLPDAKMFSLGASDMISDTELDLYMNAGTLQQVADLFDQGFKTAGWAIQPDSGSATPDSFHQDYARAGKTLKLSVWPATAGKGVHVTLSLK